MALSVKNSDNGATLVAKGKVADNPWTRLVGLMGKRELPEGDGLLIARSTSIHTCFMRIPIDVIFVSKEDRVVDVEEAMPAWRARIAKGKAHYVIELPAGTIRRSGTQVGHQLEVQR